LKNDDGVTPTIIACKYYPAGAMTNSDFGVSDWKNLLPILAAMQEVGMMLCVHSEVTHADILERNPSIAGQILSTCQRNGTINASPSQTSFIGGIDNRGLVIISSSKINDGTLDNRQI
jgi:hypothetical protein